MPTHEVKPIVEGSDRPPKGKMTWIAIAAMALFVVMLALVVLRPIVDRHDGPESGVPQVDRPAISQSGP